jgi:putative flippase GtrA
LARPVRLEPAAAVRRPASGRVAPTTILGRYVLFAVLATLANLLTQEAVFRLAPTARLSLSILAGTVVGFAVKYILDKRWIFYDAYSSHTREIRKVMLYAGFSIVTTAIFWGTEVAFWAFWETSLAKYTGAVLGLAVGYAAKYWLDREFVFTEPRP